MGKQMEGETETLDCGQFRAIEKIRVEAKVEKKPFEFRKRPWYERAEDLKMRMDYHFEFGHFWKAQKFYKRERWKSLRA